MGYLITFAVFASVTAFLTGFIIGTCRRKKGRHEKKSAIVRKENELMLQIPEYRDFLYFDGSLGNTTEREK